MAREYRCSKIALCHYSHQWGPQAICIVADDILDHASATTGPYVPQGHRLRTSPVVKVSVTAEEIAIFTESGSKYWMENKESLPPMELDDQEEIKKWLSGRDAINEQLRVLVVGLNEELN